MQSIGRRLPRGNLCVWQTFSAFHYRYYFRDNCSLVKSRNCYRNSKYFSLSWHIHYLISILSQRRNIILLKTLNIVFVVSVHLPVALASPWLSKGGFLVTNLWGTLSQRKTFPPSFDDDVVLGWPSTKGWSISCLPASHKDNFTVFHNYAGSKTLAPRLPWSFVGFKQHNICNYAFWFFLPLHCRIMTVIEDLRRVQYRNGLKSGPVCYATARPGQAENSRNLGRLLTFEILLY